MTKKRSAGLLIHRQPATGDIEVLLVHPGGPFWAKRDLGAWTIPKGEYGAGEDPLEVARREFEEETGARAPEGHALPLGEVAQAAGKLVTAFAIKADLDVSAIRSNTFEMEWPPRSGLRASFPEIDRAAWFTPDEACRRINPAQAAFIRRLLELLSGLNPSSE